MNTPLLTIIIVIALIVGGGRAFLNVPSSATDHRQPLSWLEGLD